MHFHVAVSCSLGSKEQLITPCPFLCLLFSGQDARLIHPELKRFQLEMTAKWEQREGWVREERERVGLAREGQ